MIIEPATSLRLATAPEDSTPLYQAQAEVRLSPDGDSKAWPLWSGRAAKIVLQWDCGSGARSPWRPFTLCVGGCAPRGWRQRRRAQITPSSLTARSPRPGAPARRGSARCAGRDRWWPPHTGRGPRHLERNAERSERPRRRVVDRLHHRPRERLAIGERLRDGADAPARHPYRPQPRDPRVGGVAGQRLLHEATRQLAVADAGAVGDQARAGRPFGMGHRRGEAAELGRRWRRRGRPCLPGWGRSGRARCWDDRCRSSRPRGPRRNGSMRRWPAA